MIIRLFPLFLSLAAAFAFVVSYPAIAGDRASSCSGLTTQTEITLCVIQQQKEADAALGKSYSDLMATLSPKEKTALRAAERAWVTFKEAMCEFVGLSRDGGSMQGMTVSMCLADMADEQTLKLNWQLKCRVDGTVGPPPSASCEY